MSAEPRRVTNTEGWTLWANQVVNGTFPLRCFLGGSAHSAVYLTEYKAQGLADAAIKFVRADASQAKAQLAQWEAAAALSHPHLVRLFEVGRCELEGQEYLFVVMEYAEQALAQILQQRALSPEEVRELLVPMLDGLTFLHQNQRVHGRLKPSNLLAVNDQLKLTSDTVRSASPASTRPAGGSGTSSAYDPPELHDSGVSSAGDIWGLGMTLVEALTLRTATWSEQSETASLPENFPVPFMGMARRCLSIAPASRPTAIELGAPFKPAPARAIAEPPPLPQVESSALTSERAPTASQTAAPIPATAHTTPAPIQTPAYTSTPAATPPSASTPAPKPAPPPASTPASKTASPSASTPASKSVPPSASTPAPKPAPPSAATPAPKPTPPPAATPAPKPAPPSAATPASKLAPTSTPNPAPASASTAKAPPAATPPKGFHKRHAVLASIAAMTVISLAGWVGLRGSGPPEVELPPPVVVPPPPAAPVVIAKTEEIPEPAPAAPPTTSPAVLNEVMPDVPPLAQARIRGRIYVTVRLLVDPAGDVIGVLMENPGPSRYFARLADSAAREWQFVPADEQDSRVWLVRFEFTRDGVATRVIAQ